MSDFYQRIAEVYKRESKKRELFNKNGILIAKKVIRIPITKPCHQLGATILLAFLAFPDEAKQRSKFLNRVDAKLIKLKHSQNSPERKKLQQFTKIKNKQIFEFLGVGKKAAGYRLNERMRAADVMWRKLHSNPNTIQQDSLNKIAKEAAKVNTDCFPAFFTESDGDPGDSFIKNIIWTTKPVMHLAMANYLQNHNTGLTDESIVGLILKSDQWLSETLFIAEMIRVEFASLFPGSEKNKNIKVDLKKTIAFVPDSKMNEVDVIAQLFF